MSKSKNKTPSFGVVWEPTNEPDDEAIRRVYRFLLAEDPPESAPDSKN
jgi:hypothetical protein